MNGAIPVIPHLLHMYRATLAFILKLHGSVFHVGRKHENLHFITYIYESAALLSQIIGSFVSEYTLPINPWTALWPSSWTVNKAVVLKIEVFQDIRRPESPHLKSRIALLRVLLQECPKTIFPYDLVCAVYRGSGAYLLCTGYLFLSDSCRSSLPAARVGVLLRGLRWYGEWVDRKSQGMVAK